MSDGGNTRLLHEPKAARQMADAQRPTRTPYDGSATPFTIGLKPLDLNEWIEVDDRLGDFLAEKEQHYATAFNRVFRAEEESRPAQAEVLELLAEFLPQRFPEIYRRADGVIEIAGTGRRVTLDEAPGMPLLTASRLVQEDLVIMRKGDNGWRLSAASLCFPSSWSLAEKFGRALPDIHATVPGFGPGTRADMLIARIFDNMKVDQPVERCNWSLQRDARLHHPETKRDRDARAGSGSQTVDQGEIASTFIRVERQTLRKLPASGDILFTIRIHLDPMSALSCHPERSRLAAGLARQLAALDSDQLAYKGLTADRDRLVNALQSLARA